MAYGYGSSAKEPKGVDKEVKTIKHERVKGGDKSIPPMPGKQHHEAHKGDMYRGGTHHDGACYDHKRADGVMDQE